MKKFFQKIANHLFSAQQAPKKAGHDLKNHESLSFVEHKERDTDYVFVKTFCRNGGNFLYCENKDQALVYLTNIIEEYRLEAPVWCLAPNLKDQLSLLNVPQSETVDKQQINYLNCEYLIANDGSIMLTSDQTGSRKLSVLSNQYIIYAHPDQIVKSLSEALSRICKEKSGGFPSNITTIKSGSIEGVRLPNDKQIFLLLVDED